MDPTLVNGILGIAGTFSTGALGLMGLLVRSHMSTLASMVANDTKNTAALQELVAESKATNSLYRNLVERVEGVEATIIDTRGAEALAASREATILLRESLSTIKTGQHAAVTADRVPTVPDLETLGPRRREAAK